jgi:hypothetical protein
MVSLVGAGAASHVEYVKLVTSGSAVGIYDWSLGGFALNMGFPPEIATKVPLVGAAIGLLLTFVLRRHVAASYAAAVLTTVFGSPAVNINWFVLLIALVAPLAWPVSEAPTSKQRSWPSAFNAFRASHPRSDAT